MHRFKRSVSKEKVFEVAVLDEYWRLRKIRDEEVT